jgi:hypothetical protein
MLFNNASYMLLFVIILVGVALLLSKFASQ